jgi:hypothetical protein
MKIVPVASIHFDIVTADISMCTGSVVYAQNNKTGLYIIRRIRRQRQSDGKKARKREQTSAINTHEKTPL